MFLNPRFEYPEVEQVTLDNGFRYYVCPETATKMASVTTILDSTSDKTSLEEWRARVGEKKAKMESEIACGIGSLMHEHVEAYIENRSRPSAKTPPRLMASNMADQIIQNGLQHVSEVWGVETRLYVPALYAGTCDLVGVYKNRPAIIDHKSSKKIKKKSDIVDYRDQMAAYLISHNLKYGTEIDYAVIFMATRDGNFVSIEFDTDEVEEGKRSFLNRVELFMRSAPAILTA